MKLFVFKTVVLYLVIGSVFELMALDQKIPSNVVVPETIAKTVHAKGQWSDRDVYARLRKFHLNHQKIDSLGTVMDQRGGLFYRLRWYVGRPGEVSAGCICCCPCLQALACWHDAAKLQSVLVERNQQQLSTDLYKQFIGLGFNHDQAMLILSTAEKELIEKRPGYSLGANLRFRIQGSLPSDRGVAETKSDHL